MSEQAVEQRCILLVDDDPTKLKLLSGLLSSQGCCRCVLTQDPREVLDLYRQIRPDLIVLDVNLPDLAGYRVLEQLNALSDPIMPPIVTLTPQHGRDHMVKALSLGARDIVSKPLDRVELLMRVGNLLDAQLIRRRVNEKESMPTQLVR